MSDLVEWLRAQLDADEASEWPHRPSCQMMRNPGMSCNCDAADRWYREVEAKRRIIDEHAPEWQTVEWPHDQNGKGEAQVCRRCQNAEHTEWHPAVGEAGVLPEGFVAPYVLAPCKTVRLLALSYSARPDYREEWRP